MGSKAERKEGNFFGETRKYTRHLRPQDEFSDEDEQDDLVFLRAPSQNVPNVSSRKRNKLRSMPLTSDDLHPDPIMDYEEMHATAKEIRQFSQDIISKKMAEALQKKCRWTKDHDPLEELFMAMDDADFNHEAASASSQHLARSSQKQEEREEQKALARASKNKRRKTKSKELWGLQFQGVPKVPTRFDHFFYIRKDSVALFKKQEDVRVCYDTLLPYLYLKGEDWIEKRYSLDDLQHIGRSTGFYFYKTHERVQRLYTVHTFTDSKQDLKNQVQTHSIMLFLVCARHKEECYFMVTFFFMKNI